MNLDWYLMVGRTIANIYREELGRSPSAGDEEGIVNWLYHAREHNRDADWIRDRIRESDEFLNPPPPPEPEPDPVPDPVDPDPLPPDPTPPMNVDPRDADLRSFVIATGLTSEYWPSARDGNGVAAHRVTRHVAQTLAAIDPRWGLITKGPGEQQCTWDECGRHVQGGYGEDIIAFLPGSDVNEWLGYDIIGGAGAPGARLQYGDPVPIRPGNRWAPVP